MSQIPVEIVKRKSQVSDVVTPNQPPEEIPVEIVREEAKQRPVTVEKSKLIAIEKPVFVPIEKPKLKRKVDFSPEETVSTNTAFAPRVSYDYDFSPFDFLARSRTFAPRFAYDYEYAPEEFASATEVFSPSEAYDSTFAPKYESLKKSVYSPSTVIKNKFAPKVERKIAFKPRLFDKLLAIFAPEAILKQKAELAFKPYNYQYTQTAIIDAYNPEQITSVEKFAPKDESNFNLRIAPETDFTIKISQPTPMFFSSVYIDLLKKIIR